MGAVHRYVCRDAVRRCRGNIAVIIVCERAGPRRRYQRRMVPYADFNLIRFPDRDKALAKIKDLTGTFDSMAFFVQPEWNLSGFGPAQRVNGAAVTRSGCLVVIRQCSAAALSQRTSALVRAKHSE